MKIVYRTSLYNLFCYFVKLYEIWTGAHSLVHELVGGVLVEGEVEPEVLVLQILGEVHLGLGLVDDDVVLLGHAGHVDLLPLLLLRVDRALPHAHGDLKCEKVELNHNLINIIQPRLIVEVPISSKL